jgi:membrane protease YdiL (CAAX protease family)
LTTEPDDLSPLHKIFVGVDGLRAGWGLLLFLVLFAALMLMAIEVSRLFSHPTLRTGVEKAAGMSLSTTLEADSIPFVLTLFATWIMAKIERRPAANYGLGGSSKLSHFLAGLAWGVICLSLLVLILWKTGYFVFDSRLLFGSGPFRYGALWFTAFLSVGLFEEYFTRGYLLFTLSRGLAGIYKSLFKSARSGVLGFWTAALALSVFFGLGHGHNPGESPLGLLCAGLAGLVFCLSLWRTGSLWWAIGFHAAWDWAQSFLYGAADSGALIQNHLFATHPVGEPLFSGGGTGPEGSIFVIVIMVLICVIVIFTLPRGVNARDVTSAEYRE